MARFSKDWIWATGISIVTLLIQYYGKANGLLISTCEARAGLQAAQVLYRTGLVGKLKQEGLKNVEYDQWNYFYHEEHISF